MEKLLISIEYYAGKLLQRFKQLGDVTLLDPKDSVGVEKLIRHPACYENNRSCCKRILSVLNISLFRSLANLVLPYAKLIKIPNAQKIKDLVSCFCVALTTFLMEVMSTVR